MAYYTPIDINMQVKIEKISYELKKIHIMHDIRINIHKKHLYLPGNVRYDSTS